jgi:polyisoprenoid-binding protein YceI
MKTKRLSTLFILLIAPFLVIGQFNVNNSQSTLSVFGTSTLHDWEIKAEKVSGTASITVEEELAVSSLSFSVVVEELESGKGAMNDNTYEALEEKKYPTIDYKLGRVLSSKSMGGNSFVLNTEGQLTIAGTTKDVVMSVTAVVNGGDVKFSGDYTMKMTDFNIDPPTAVWGTIKTGDEIKIEFSINYSK